MTTTLDIILYHAHRLFEAERKHTAEPSDKNLKAMELRKKEISKVIGKLSIKQGNLF
jgi:hypothetical protein